MNVGSWGNVETIFGRPPPTIIDRDLGARHLAVRLKARQRWLQFMDIFEEEPGLDISTRADIARQLFAKALSQNIGQWIMDRDADLTSCDREPIHIPGTVQPHGCLLACDISGRVIVRRSDNVQSMLGLSADPLNRRLDDVLGEGCAHSLMNALARSPSPSHAGLVFGQELGGAKFDIEIHQHAGSIIIEFEPASQASEASALDVARSLIVRTAALTDLAAVTRLAPRFVRTLLGFDRVMLYQLAEDGSGKVIGEAKRADLESFLGQHFPASDIPQQARALYLKNPIRVIADVNGVGRKIEPQRDASDQPLDLSFAHLRSVSPIHLEYLRNMGVAASMSLSIIIDGQLWGLVACHHYTPRTVTMVHRVASAMFVEFLSQHLVAIDNRQRFDAALRGGGGSLHRLLSAELSPYPESQVLLNGEDVMLDARAFSVMALVAHELATNAVKHGALSVAEGRLTVNWVINDLGDLELEWSESNGPYTRSPTRQGFGSVLLQRSVPFDLNGTSDIRYEETGLKAAFVIPSRYVSPGARPGSQSQPKDAQSLSADFSLQDRTVLLVEDQLVIALDVEDMLGNLGARVLTAPSAQAALGVLSRSTPDCAVLDVTLGRGTSLPVAEELEKRGIGYVFATGHRDTTMIPERFRLVPIIRKPYDEQVLKDALFKVIKQRL